MQFPFSKKYLYTNFISPILYLIRCIIIVRKSNHPCAHNYLFYAHPIPGTSSYILGHVIFTIHPSGYVLASELARSVS